MDFDLHEITSVYSETKYSRLISSVVLMRKKISISLFLQFFLINLLLVNIAFFGMNYYKRSTFELDVKYFKLLLLFYVVWFSISYFTKKFHLSSYPDIKHTFILIAKSNLYILYILSLVIVLQGLYAFSRIQLFGTCLILFIMEFTVFFAFYYTIGKKLINSKSNNYLISLKFKNFSLLKFFTDLAIFSFSFYIMNYFKRDTIELSPIYEELFMVLFALWLTSSLFTKKYEKRNFRNVFYAISPFVKSFILSVAVVAVIVFAFRMFYYSRLHIFGTFLLTLILESIIYYVYFIYKSKSSTVHDIENYEEVYKILKQENLPFELDSINRAKNRTIHSVKDKLKHIYLKEHDRLFKFIDNRINLLKIDESDIAVLNTNILYNIQTIDDHSTSLILNLHKVNDIRWLNRYFLEVHKKIYNGGFFVGKVDTIVTYKKKFYKKYSKVIADIFYPISFVFKRVFPKLPVFKQFYFFLTHGKNRIISKAEVLGRLYFCGFKIIDVKELEDSLYFIAQRVKRPSIEKNPSYGPVVKLKRVGFNKDIIEVYKLRTMHPYSEFLQQYIYESYGTKNGDKFNNDFRITSWGELFRRFWIDELPMLINYIQGDLKIVGVRPLSVQKFQLYRLDLQKLRTEHKPGLVPPFYADMPDTLDGLMDSEEKYLKSYEKHPIKTDIKYFFKAFYNIIFKKARSK